MPPTDCGGLQKEIESHTPSLCVLAQSGQVSVLQKRQSPAACALGWYLCLSCALFMHAGADHVAALLLPLLQFQYELAVASMVLADDADKLGGLLANSSGWLGASDETHCGKMATLKVSCWLCCLVVKKPALSKGRPNVGLAACDGRASVCFCWSGGAAMKCS